MSLLPEYIRFLPPGDSTPADQFQTESRIEWKSIPPQNWRQALGECCARVPPDTWFILTNYASDEGTSRIEPVVAELQNCQSDIHLTSSQGFNALPPHWDPLFLWRHCSPRIAALWNAPGPQFTVSIRNSALQSAISMAPWPSGRPPEPQKKASSAAEIIWKILVRTSELAPRVAVATALSQSSPHPSSEHEDVPLPPLAPSQPGGSQPGIAPVWLKDLILSQKPAYFSPRLQSQADAVALKAGLCQWHGWLNESHQLAQSIEGLGRNHAGDYWHAIHHRREPDFSNAKYWFRQLGAHPVFQGLVETVPHFPDFQLARTWSDKLMRAGKWDPLAFVDLCEACVTQQGKSIQGSSPSAEIQALIRLAESIQATEMKLLILATWQDTN